MKTTTDIEQSKKLAEFLPIESADMDYIPIVNLGGEYSITVNVWGNEHEDDWIPAWSLPALMELMPKVNGRYPDLCRGKETGLYYMWIEDEFDTQTYNDPIDAAIEMIGWLKENNLI